MEVHLLMGDIEEIKSALKKACFKKIAIKQRGQAPELAILTAMK